MLEDSPYRWGTVDELFDGTIADQLVSTYPAEAYRTVVGNDGEKAYEYEARALVAMGNDRPEHPELLSPVWRTLADELVSAPYRTAMSALTECDLASVPIEVNVFHYGPGSSLGAHSDLADKVVTHILYFNENWNPALGGCLRILQSPDINDVVAEIEPSVGGSSVIVRSELSYHAVTPVAPTCTDSRRSMTVTFYRPGSVSTLWPPHEHFVLHAHRPPVRVRSPETHQTP